jgi:hypothetical protein
MLQPKGRGFEFGYDLIFQLHNSSSPTLVLGLTRSLPIMSARNYLCGNRALRALKAKLNAISESTVKDK